MPERFCTMCETCNILSMGYISALTQTSVTFLQNPGTEGQNMRPNKLIHIYMYIYVCVYIYMCMYVYIYIQKVIIEI